MTWLAPWALFGVSAIALPMLIHLLGRRRAKTQLFPTLRFIGQSRLLPTRRTRLHDLLLLLVRVAIIASAALALAQPYWRTPTRREAFERTLARAIVLDTSASVRRALSVDSSRALADQLARDANVSVLLSSNDVTKAIPGALAWLSQQAERRELVIVSDFQEGAIDANTIARIPSEVGVQLMRVGMRVSGSGLVTVSRLGTNIVTARATALAGGGIGLSSATPAERDIEWVVRASEPQSNTAEDVGDSGMAVRVLAGVQESARAGAAMAAANSVSEALPASDSPQAIAIVTVGAEQRATLLANARVPSRTRMLRTLSEMIGDESLRAAVAGERDIAPTDSSKLLVVARTADGRAAVLAAEATVDGRSSLVLFDNAEAGSLTTATLIVAARRASRAPFAETNPAQVADSTLRKWQRTPSTELRPAATRSDDAAASNASDGRWLWVLALLLLVVETMLRRVDRGVTTDANADAGSAVSARARPQ